MNNYINNLIIFFPDIFCIETMWNGILWPEGQNTPKFYKLKPNEQIKFRISLIDSNIIKQIDSNHLFLDFQIPYIVSKTFLKIKKYLDNKKVTGLLVNDSNEINDIICFTDRGVRNNVLNFKIDKFLNKIFTRNKNFCIQENK
jgi:hypothetical protein